jgi:hypothetical protein
MSPFDQFLDEFQTELAQLVQTEFQDFADAAMADARRFVEHFRADLQRWTLELAALKLSPDDFAFLVQSKKDLAVLHALREKDLSRETLEDFSQRLAQVIVHSAVKALL